MSSFFFVICSHQWHVHEFKNSLKSMNHFQLLLLHPVLHGVDEELWPLLPCLQKISRHLCEVNVNHVHLQFLMHFYIIGISLWESTVSFSIVRYICACVEYHGARGDRQNKKLDQFVISSGSSFNIRWDGEACVNYFTYNKKVFVKRAIASQH